MVGTKREKYRRGRFIFANYAGIIYGCAKGDERGKERGGEAVVE